MISDSVLDLEFSFWTLELEKKFPTPKVAHISEIGFIISRSDDSDLEDEENKVRGQYLKRNKVDTVTQ